MFGIRTSGVFSESVDREHVRMSIAELVVSMRGTENSPNLGGCRRRPRPLHVESFGSTQRQLSVGMQNNQIVVWAKVTDPVNLMEDVAFTVVNTGMAFTFTLARFLGTVTSDNDVVWHVFLKDELDWRVRLSVV